MGSPLGPLMTNELMCNIEEKLENQNKMPAFYKRHVDDTLSKRCDVSSASEFLLTMNEIHPSLSFTMELKDSGKLPFLGMVIIRNGLQLDTKVYVKPTDTGLLLLYQSHVDVKYKHSLLKTMLNHMFISLICPPCALTSSQAHAPHCIQSSICVDPSPLIFFIPPPPTHPLIGTLAQHF